MSWQDELRRLDEELAAGRISADDYRSRRDHILSTAVAPGTENTNASESTAMMPPVQPPGQQPGQQPRQGHGGDADQTQIVSSQDLADSDRTQAVGWRATPPEDPNRTQVVPGVPPQTQAGARPLRPAPPPGPHSPPDGFPQQNQPPWQAEENLAPPWAGQEFPPLAAAGTPDWARQGPEVFETEKKSSPAKVFGIIAIVVVLVGIAAGAYFLFRPDEGSKQADQQEKDDPPVSETAPPSETEPQGPIVELPGTPQDLSRVTSFADVKSIDYLTQQEIDIYAQGGAGDAAMALSRDDGVTVIVVHTTMESEEAAITARDALAALQLKFHLKEIDAPEGVLAARNAETSNGPLTRAHFVSGRDLIRIQTVGKDGDAAIQAFDDVLDDQLELSPVDG